MEEARSVRQREQRRWEEWPFRKLWDGGEAAVEVLEVEVVEVLESVLDLRRRKGREGTR